MRPMGMVLLSLLAVSAVSVGQDVKPSEATDKGVPQTLDASLNNGLTLWFETINYATLFCKRPRDAAHANLISQGVPMTSDPSADAQWMKKKAADGSCWQQPPNQRFVVTPASPVYLNNAMIIWTVGVKSPKSGLILGYVPIDNIRIIPIPTL